MMGEIVFQLSGPPTDWLVVQIAGSSIMGITCYTHNTTAMSQILFSVIPFKLASDANVLTPQKCVYLSNPS